jgi:hypothetical protein
LLHNHSATAAATQNFCGEVHNQAGHGQREAPPLLTELQPASAMATLADTASQLGTGTSTTPSIARENGLADASKRNRAQSEINIE